MFAGDDRAGGRTQFALCLAFWTIVHAALVQVLVGGPWWLWVLLVSGFGLTVVGMDLAAPRAVRPRALALFASGERIDEVSKHAPLGTARFWRWFFLIARGLALALFVIVFFKEGTRSR